MIEKLPEKDRPPSVQRAPSGGSVGPHAALQLEFQNQLLCECTIKPEYGVLKHPTWSSERSRHDDPIEAKRHKGMGNRIAI